MHPTPVCPWPLPLIKNNTQLQLCQVQGHFADGQGYAAFKFNETMNRSFAKLDMQSIEEEASKEWWLMY